MREVKGLRWARVVDRPRCVPVGRPRGAKLRGVKFERALAVMWPFASHGVWFEFEDAAGHGYAQADFVWPQSGGWIVGEAKLTWRREAYVQLRRLYWPLVEAVWGGAPRGLVVCRNVTRETPQVEVVGSLPEALDRALGGRMIPTLHLPLVGA